MFFTRLSRQSLWLLGIWFVGILLQGAFFCLYYFPDSKILSGDEGYYYNLAKAIARGEAVIQDPLWPPLYADVLGQLFRVFGIHRVAMQLIQIAFMLAGGGLVYGLARRLLPSRQAALVVLGLYLFSPELIAFSHFLWPEIPFLFFFTLTLWLLICCNGKRLTPVLAGISLGVSLLLKLLVLPFVPVMLVFPLLMGKKRGSGLRQAGIMAAAFVLTILPTMKQNHRVHGEWMIADSSVFNLWVGLNDVELLDYRNDITGDWLASFRASGADIATRNRVHRQKILELLEHRGWMNTLAGQLSKQYFRLMDYETFFSTQLAGGPREAYRLRQPAITWALHFYAHLWYAVLLAGAALGICYLRPKPLGWLHLAALWLAYNAGLFALVHVKTRYMLQVMPVMMIFAGLAFHGWRGSLSPASNTPFTSTKTRLACGVGLAILWELIAFRSFFWGP